MAMKMATVEKAGELLEKLRSASWDSAVKGSHLVSKFPCGCSLAILSSAVNIGFLLVSES